MVGNLSDIALNVLLVLVFDMGTRGAALSTALGQVITIAIYLPGFSARSTFCGSPCPGEAGWGLGSRR